MEPDKKVTILGYIGIIGTMILFGLLSQEVITAQQFYLPELALQGVLIVYYYIRKDNPSMTITVFYAVNAVIGLFRVYFYG